MVLADMHDLPEDVEDYGSIWVFSLVMLQ